MSRIYQAVPLQAPSSLVLDEKASHHIARVLRAAPGDKLTLFNGQGGEYGAIITQISKKGVTVDLLHFEPQTVESPIEICLAQGIARGEKMDFIVQKAVELGVNKIVPLITERCNVRLDNERENKRLSHWQSVIISACEQSGRNHIPEIVAPMILNQWLPTATADYRFVLSPHITTKFLQYSINTPRQIILLIGPEGGLSEKEITTACQQGFLPLNLGPRVLRTETATIAAMTLIQSQFGDLR